jgi:hypothetical protein
LLVFGLKVKGMVPHSCIHDPSSVAPKNPCLSVKTRPSPTLSPAGSWRFRRRQDSTPRPTPVRKCTVKIRTHSTSSKGAFFPSNQCRIALYSAPNQLSVGGWCGDYNANFSIDGRVVLLPGGVPPLNPPIKTEMPFIFNAFDTCRPRGMLPCLYRTGAGATLPFGPTENGLYVRLVGL